MIGSNELLNIVSLIKLETSSNEDKLQSIDNGFCQPKSVDQCKDAFAVTICSSNVAVNEIIAQIGDFNYDMIDKIPSNPNRIFRPIIKCDTGDMYQGEYDTVNKQRDGRGRQIWSSGEVFDGFWKNGSRNGYGRYVYVSGNYCIGEWKDGKINGYGKYYYKSGSSYEGQWVNHKSEGLGLYKWISGQQYYGQWVNDKRQGVGVFTSKSGNILGQRKNGQDHGIQMYIPSDGGQIEINKYENNKLIETLLKIDNGQN
ncbi:UNKNOWN [Stylonychia lemnae]|uniref:Morn repeat protein n=1 Tax=Stylonychia lemnae TaxID=5949 RepID=A0A077ZXZ2_STYLE|nr:UNKNOWN [Stylonychia lemnae]|eukprot:CDW74102.1 UNKNOWN [Stylonychia lemnae]